MLGLIGKYYFRRRSRTRRSRLLRQRVSLSSAAGEANRTCLSVPPKQETADTLHRRRQNHGAALRRYCHRLAASVAARICDGVINMQVEPEIGVATAQKHLPPVRILFCRHSFGLAIGGVLWWDEKRDELSVGVKRRLPGFFSRATSEDVSSKR